MSSGAADQPINRLRRFVTVARRDLCVHERSPQRSSPDAGGIDLAQRAREHNNRESRFASLEKGRGEWDCCLDMGVQTSQKLFGFLEATLSDA